MSYRGRKNVGYELVSVCGEDVLLDMRIKRKKKLLEKLQCPKPEQLWLLYPKQMCLVHI